MREEMYLDINGKQVKIDAITSDTHWGHVNIAKLANRPFDNSVSTTEMDQFLIEKWNKAVNDNDTVLHLGDVAMGLVKETLLNIKKCNGRKILIPGNHDYIGSFSSASRREKHQEIYRECFDEILPEMGNMLTVIQGDEKVTVQVSHYPTTETYLKEGYSDKFAKYRPNLNVAPLIHGHTHSPNMISVGGQQLHVGVDATPDYMPVTAELIAKWAFALPSSNFSDQYSKRPVSEPWGIRK